MSTLCTEEIIASSIVWDNHSCLPLRADNSFLPELDRFRRAGYSFASINVGFDLTTVQENLQILAHFRNWIRDHQDDFLLVGTAKDVVEAKRTGKLGIAFDIEGTVALANQLSMVEAYYDLGVRWMLMAYNKNNSVGGGCIDDDAGLTRFGREVLDEMTRVGMVPCCSHTGWKTAAQVLEYADGPVIFSHSNSYAVHTQPRNIPDYLIKACAETGGVVGLDGLGRLIGMTVEGKYDASTEALFRHLDHMVQLVGPEHVGLALDYVFDLDELVALYRSRPDMFPSSLGYPRPAPMVEPERLPALVKIMIDHQYPVDAIKQIIGGNFLRVAKATWK